MPDIPTVVISCLCLFQVSECCFQVCSDKPGFGVWRLLSCFAEKSYHTHYHSIVVAGNCSFSLTSIFKCQVKRSHSLLHFMSQLWRSAFYGSHEATCAQMLFTFLQPQQKLNMWCNFHSRLQSSMDVTHQAGHRLVSLKCSFSSSCVVIALQITMTAGGNRDAAGLTATHHLGVGCHGHRCISTY